jgi:hypothetical protein
MRRLGAVALVGLVGCVFLLSQSSRGDDGKIVNGTLHVHVIGCTFQSAQLDYLIVNGASPAATVSDQDISFEAPAGFDIVKFEVAHCQVGFNTLVYSNSTRNVTVVGSEITSTSYPCVHLDCLEYIGPEGHVMGRLPDQIALVVELRQDDKLLRTAQVQNGVYYFDIVPAGTYTLRVSRPNWYADIRNITISDSEALAIDKVQVIDISTSDIMKSIHYYLQGPA